MERGTGGEDVVTTVGDAVPQAGQNAEPDGISARHEGQVG